CCSGCRRRVACRTPRPAPRPARPRSTACRPGGGSAMPAPSVGSCPDRLLPGLAAADEATLRRLRRPELLERQDANRRLGVLLRLLLAARGAAPPGVDETADALHDLAEAVVVLHAAVGVLLPAPHGRRQHRILDRLEPGRDRRQRRRLGDELLPRTFALFDST